MRYDIRNLRLALGLSVQSACGLLQEPESLLLNQEAAAGSADRAFVSAVARRYLLYGAQLIQRRQVPTITTTSGSTAFHHLRLGLGLQRDDASAILRVRTWDLEPYELASHRLDGEVLTNAWGLCLDWAVRSDRRQARRQRVADRRLMAQRKLMQRFPSVASEFAELQRLAYQRPPSSAEAEEAVWRFLDTDTA